MSCATLLCCTGSAVGGDAVAEKAGMKLARKSVSDLIAQGSIDLEDDAQGTAKQLCHACGFDDMKSGSSTRGSSQFRGNLPFGCYSEPISKVTALMLEADRPERLP